MRHVLWRDPGRSPRSICAKARWHQRRPVPPFRFVEEHLGGTQPCLSVTDARGRRWRAKWGEEVNSETFAVRFAWACGYFAEVTYFVSEGTIDGAKDLQRTSACLDENHRFASARFELDDPKVVKHFEEHSWAWNDNPSSAAELQGLKIVTCCCELGHQGPRDVARGSNTAIFEHVTRGCARRTTDHDWGGSMGRWVRCSPCPVGRRGVCRADAALVAGVDDGVVKFGYSGQRTGTSPRDHAKDVRWLCRLLDQISDAQLDDALRASGHRTRSASISNRDPRSINQLQRVALPPQCERDELPPCC